MIGAAYAAMAASMVQSQMDQYEEKAFQAMLEKAPIECRGDLISERAKEKEKKRLEAREERMHREMCDAIRESGSKSKVYSQSGVSGSSFVLGMLIGESFR